MKSKLSSRKFAAAVTLVLSSLAFVLRLVQRRVSLNADGGHSASFLWPLIVMSVLALLFAALTALSLRPRPGFSANHLPSNVSLAGLPAALLLMIASAVRFFTMTGVSKWLMGLLGIVGAVCMGLITLRILRRERPSFVLYAVLTVSLICKLIPDFRSWSIDPRISDYCFRLFAMIAVMCVSFLLSSFALEQGQRRATVFAAMLGVFFSAMSVADGGLANALSFLSYALFQYASLWQLLTEPRKRRTLRRPEPEEARQ
ncbi:MAG: hypothetical protein VB055_04655 [Oscillospiraceae bacterium]|nr:hypothetical protein [Oscillospiraceae bacterium]